MLRAALAAVVFAAGLFASLAANASTSPTDDLALSATAAFASRTCTDPDDGRERNPLPSIAASSQGPTSTWRSLATEVIIARSVTAAHATRTEPARPRAPAAPTHLNTPLLI